MIFILIGVLSEVEKDLTNRIFSKMNAKMYHISYRILGSHFEAEEAVAQTFLKIMTNIDKISALPCPQIEPYCVIILKNETMNIIRQRKKNIYTDSIDYFEYNQENHILEEEYIKKADKEELLSCIDKLSDEEKNLIYLRFIYEMSFKEISELLDINEETAKKRGQRILKKLRLYYEKGDGNV